jgi:hypothetical protein
MRGTLAGSLVVTVLALSCTSDTEIQQEPAIRADGREVWRGTMHSETRTIAEGTCRGSADATLRLVVAADGTVTGEANVTGPDEVCRAGPGRLTLPGPDAIYSVRGSKSATEFTLTFGFIEGQAGVGFGTNTAVESVVPITGSTRAEGEFLAVFPGIPEITSLNTFALDCESCEEAVG